MFYLKEIQSAREIAESLLLFEKLRDELDENKSSDEELGVVARSRLSEISIEFPKNDDHAKNDEIPLMQTNASEQPEKTHPIETKESNEVRKSGKKKHGPSTSLDSSRTNRTNSNRTSKLDKRNNKGETLLHVAVIKVSRCSYIQA